MLFIFSVFFLGSLGFYGCDFISYGLILLSLWICVLMILARESVPTSIPHLLRITYQLD